MASAKRKVPSQSYGILVREASETALDEAVEQVRAIGYATLDSGYSDSELEALSNGFNAALESYQATHGRAFLETLNEHNNIRLMSTQGEGMFLRLALNPNLLKALGKLIAGKFMLNQQNGIINPPKEGYNQGAWHRDLPYQHFLSSTPLAVNALFCMDDFTLENGATFVLPASHKTSEFPSAGYVEKNALQVPAKAGQFILLDCMTFHCGGYNGSDRARRAVNHLYNIPYFKQQINIPGNLDATDLSPQAKEILGFNFQESKSLGDFFDSRKK
ncbi:phytanoyl-CoA dioxygenase family protein [Variovorax sp. M-6]|uniref:phytanoyl-CoA dioxygenase family protein n=1 Tax=Variovorax sp. M-6 TaxID=3233041 RepID=UPI003F9A28DF